MNIVETRNLSVVYKGGVRALDGLDLNVREGEIFCLVGPNGAGKTTTMRVLTTLLRPTGGWARVAGYDVVKEAGKVRKMIGYVPQNLSADDELTGMENMILQCRLYGIRGREARERSLRLLELVGLREAADRLVASYSGGMRRRLELAMGLVHTPRTLFLDEPTLGLDVHSRVMIWEHIRRLNHEEKTTILFTTHYMDEADKISDRVAIIDHGKIVAMGRPEDLKSSIGGDVIKLKINGRINGILSGIDEIIKVDEIDGEYRVKVKNGEEALPRILRILEERGIKVVYASLVKPTLDQVFVEYTGREYREEEEQVDVRVMTYVRERKR